MWEWGGQLVTSIHIPVESMHVNSFMDTYAPELCVCGGGGRAVGMIHTANHLLNKVA